MEIRNRNRTRVPEGEAVFMRGYVILGPEECYLHVDGWYFVNNPSDPPVGEPV